MIGFLFEQVGLVSILRSLSIPLCLAAAATGLLVLNRSSESRRAAVKNGRLGLILGLAGIGAALLIMALVMFLFLPLLFLSR